MKVLNEIRGDLFSILYGMEFGVELSEKQKAYQDGINDAIRIVDGHIMPEQQDDILSIQKEMLELTIKAGRRLMHDFNHMLNEIPETSTEKEMYSSRGKMWGDIFYPDDGPKNYRSSLHQEIIELEFKLNRAKKLLVENNIDPDPDSPF